MGDIHCAVTPPTGLPRSCAFCRGDLLVPQAALRCPECEATVHQDCRYRLKSCPTLGCTVHPRELTALRESGRGRLEPRWTPARGERSRRALVAAVPAAVVLILVSSAVWSALLRPIVARSCVARSPLSLEEAIAHLRSAEDSWPASQGLVSHGDAALVPLLRLVQDPAEGRRTHRRALQVLEALPTSALFAPWVAPVMATVLDREDRLAHRQACRLLGRLGPDGVIELTKVLASAPRASVRRRAGYALTQFVDADRLPVHRLLGGLDPSVEHDRTTRAWIAILLGRSFAERPRTKEALDRAAKTDPDAVVRIAAHVALAGWRRGCVALCGPASWPPPPARSLTCRERSYVAWVVTTPTQSAMTRRLQDTLSPAVPSDVIERALRLRMSSRSAAERLAAVARLEGARFSGTFAARHAKPLLPALRNLADEDEDPRVRAAANRVVAALVPSTTTGGRAACRFMCRGPAARLEDPATEAVYAARPPRDWLADFNFSSRHEDRWKAEEALEWWAGRRNLRLPTTEAFVLDDRGEARGALLLQVPDAVRFFTSLRPFDLVTAVEVGGEAIRIGSGADLDAPLAALLEARRRGDWSGCLRVLRKGRRGRLGVVGHLAGPAPRPAKPSRPA